MSNMPSSQQEEDHRLMTAEYDDDYDDQFDEAVQSAGELLQFGEDGPSAG
jgi:hypothetical protein